MDIRTKDRIITWMLTPLAWCYGTVTAMRNILYDKHILRTQHFDIPIVGVGNLAIGGTGKTPHVEYIVEHLASRYNICVISRGYKRRTKGYVLANAKSTPDTIGDEPYQIYQKYGDRINVAVCENRAEGIRQMMQDLPQVNLIVVDDAFQHRGIQPKVQILLTDHNHPYYEDSLLPLGRLRESPLGAHRADIVIVTKCPTEMSPLDYRIISKSLDLMPFQRLFFSEVDYGQLMPVFPEDTPYKVDLDLLTPNDSVMLLQGIANPRNFVRHFKKYPFRKVIDHFPDHHNFTRRNIQEIIDKFEKLRGEHKIIITTEKDATRLVNNPYFPKKLKPLTFYLPIKVKIKEGLDGDDFIPVLCKAIEEKQHPLADKYM